MNTDHVAVHRSMPAVRNAIRSAPIRPVRSFGPAALGWYWADHWVYWVAPVVGVLFAAVFHTILRERGEVESG